jgi:DnaK suppressor protein
MYEDLEKRLGAQHRRLERIEAALQRLERGTYGYCQVCSAKIPIDLLESDPTRHVCSDCTRPN